MSGSKHRSAWLDGMSHTFLDELEKKLRHAPQNVDFFLTRISIGRMLRDNTPVNSTESLQPSASCPALRRD